MKGPGVSTLELRVIERVLEMEGGYVVDFTDRTFAAFFSEHGVDIDDPGFRVGGTSKANRLRHFLRVTEPPLSGRVLAALLQHRLACKQEPPQNDIDAYRAIVARLGGELSEATMAAEGAAGTSTEADLLRLIFNPATFANLPVDDSMSRALVERMEESQRCIASEAYLASVILCGSVLEGMCLGFGRSHPERMNRAYGELYHKSPGKLHEWKLREWIDVLGKLGDLSPNVEKFGHALRDFRNYVHPAEQLAHKFSLDQHTARIGFQVVVAAADDLVRAETAIGGAVAP